MDQHFTVGTVHVLPDFLYIFSKKMQLSFRCKLTNLNSKSEPINFQHQRITYDIYFWNQKKPLKSETLLSDCTWYIYVENNEPVCPTQKESMSKEFPTNYGARLFIATTNVFFSTFSCKDSIKQKYDTTTIRVVVHEFFFSLSTVKYSGNDIWICSFKFILKFNQLNLFAKCLHRLNAEILSFNLRSNMLNLNH